jgi:hypothetical protein
MIVLGFRRTELVRFSELFKKAEISCLTQDEKCLSNPPETNTISVQHSITTMSSIHSRSRPMADCLQVEVSPSDRSPEFILVNRPCLLRYCHTDSMKVMTACDCGKYR